MYRAEKEGCVSKTLHNKNLCNLDFDKINEPPHGKTNNLHRRKQRRRSASQ